MENNLIYFTYNFGTYIKIKVKILKKETMPNHILVVLYIRYYIMQSRK